MEINSLTRKIATAERSAVATAIMAVCRAVTPQFYKNQTDEEVQFEMANIQLLTGHIETPTLAKMCELAVKGYPLARSTDQRIYFDINYILTFYKQAFNIVNCHEMQVSVDATIQEVRYCPITSVVTEIWECNGQTWTIRAVIEPPKRDTDHIYSPKYWEIFKARNAIELEGE